MPANAIPFQDICELLENLHKRMKQKQKQEVILCNKFDEFKMNIAEIETTNKKTMFPVLRLLVPDYDKERGAYNIQKQKLCKLLINVLRLNEKSGDAKSLLAKASGGHSSEFVEHACNIIKNNITPKDKSLTVGEINGILDKIASTGEEKHEKNLQNIFTGLVKTLNTSQCKWFFKILLKDLKIGMSSNFILNCFHPDGQESYHSCKRLSKVCEDLSDGNNRRKIEIFSPISPMFSARLNVTKIRQCLSVDKTYHIETKFDGERFQMHMENGQFAYFSRNSKTYTDSFGGSYNDGPLTCFLKDCFASDVKSFILDGEMMGWHKEKQEFGSKGMPFDVKHLLNHREYRPCFCVFDILYYNGRSLVGEKEKGGVPLKERCEILDKMFTEIPGVIYRSKRTPVTSFEDVVDAINAAIDNREEGIVVKETDSYYMFNNRNAGWYKVKPEYTEGSAPDLDLVIIGVHRGEFLRHGTVKSYLLACADSDTPGVLADQWICVGNVGLGLSYEEHQKLAAGLREHWKESAKTPPPPNIRFNKVKPHFWIDPRNSVILEICATELIRSKDFASEYTLRFPRIKRIRDDKLIEHVMTITEYNNLCPDKGAVSKLSTKRIEMEQIDSAPKIKKRTIKEVKVSEDFKLSNCDDVEVVSRALDGRKVHILSDDEDCNKEQLERIVKSHSGKIVANCDASTWCCIAGRKLPIVCSMINSQEQDVLTTAWLRSLPISESVCSFEPLDALCLKEETRLKMARNYDKYGDSYTELIDEEKLKNCFNYMNGNEPKIYLTSQEMFEMDKMLFENNNPFSFLRSCFIYLPDEKSLNAFKARMYGATLCDIGDISLTHVVMPKFAVEEIRRLKDSVDVPVVSEDWLESCFAKETLISVSEFIL